jgi:hypothetical protein
MPSLAQNPQVSLPRPVVAFVVACCLLPLSALASAPRLAVSNPHAPTASPATPAEAPGQAGFSKLDPTPPTGLTPAEIITRFGEREAAFAKARDEYTFRQSVTIDTISDDTNKPDGEYHQVTDIVFSDKAARTERVVFAPANTLERLILTENDIDDIAHRLPFVLTTPELPQYDLTYLGRQKVDDIDTYVFDCKPRELVKGKRYFQGKVWVDQQQFEIVLINGKAVPDNLKRGHEDLSPPYTTYYQEIDAGNWFPVYTKADGVLHFPAENGALPNDVHLRYVVTYKDYKRFRARSRIIFNGQDLPADSTTPPPAPKPDAPHALPPPQDPSALPPPDPNAPSLKRPKPPKP